MFNAHACTVLAVLLGSLPGSSDWAATLDFLAAGLIGTSAVFYSLWLYSLYCSGNFTHMFHLGLTVVANGTRIFRLLALSDP